MMEQLVLNVSLNDGATFANFYPGVNQLALKSLLALVAGEGEQFIYLWGGLGIGRSHLLQACCHSMRESGKPFTYLSLQSINQLSPTIFEGLEGLSLICLDDLDNIIGFPDWEESLFHLYNRIQATGTRLVATASTSPLHLKSHLPDLQSRLSYGLIFQLHSLSDEDKSAALTLRAKSKGLELSTEASQFLLQHCSRDATTLFAILEKLDQASLVKKRKLTVPFIKEVLSHLTF